MCEHETTYNNLMLAYISLWANTGLCHNLTFGLWCLLIGPCFLLGVLPPQLDHPFGWYVGDGGGSKERGHLLRERLLWVPSGRLMIGVLAVPSPIGWRSPADELRSFAPMCSHIRARESIRVSSQDVCRRCGTGACLAGRSLHRFRQPIVSCCKLGGINFCFLIPLLCNSVAG